MRKFTIMKWLDLLSKYRCKQLCPGKQSLTVRTLLFVHLFARTVNVINNRCVRVRIPYPPPSRSERSKQFSQLVHWQTSVQTTLDYLQGYLWEVHSVLNERLTD